MDIIISLPPHIKLSSGLTSLTSLDCLTVHWVMMRYYSEGALGGLTDEDQAHWILSH